MMANIAQAVNVLQSVILTDGSDMLLTPTYHVFKMYKDHQENTLLGSLITTDSIDTPDGKMSCPQLIESASIDKNGVIPEVVEKRVKKPLPIHLTAKVLKSNVRLPIQKSVILRRKFFQAKFTIKMTLTVKTMLLLRNLMILHNTQMALRQLFLPVV